jgi:cyclic nucleotide-binding protein/HEAT repeat protein
VGDQDPEVRAAAFRAIGAIDSSRAVDLLEDALADESALVRDAVADTLATIGGPGTGRVVRSLSVPERQSAALQALDRLPLAAGERDDVRRFAAEAVGRAVDSYRVASTIRDDGDERLALLRDSLLLRSERQAIAGLQAAAVLGDRGAMAVAIESVSVIDPTQRANALEVIESVGERELVRPLLSMWEAAASSTTIDHTGLEGLREDPDPWIRACADLVAVANEGGTMTKSVAVLPLMERVLFLRKVPLFAELPPPDLQPIAGIAQEQTFADGEAIAEQGDPGDAMYIIVSGEVAVVVRGDAGERVVAVRPSGEVVGEMAVITSEPRMAGLVARGPVRVLSIERRQFESILRERPGTSLGVIRVLCHRLTAIAGEEGLGSATTAG